MQDAQGHIGLCARWIIVNVTCLMLVHNGFRAPLFSCRRADDRARSGEV